MAKNVRAGQSRGRPSGRTECGFKRACRNPSPEPHDVTGPRGALFRGGAGRRWRARVFRAHSSAAAGHARCVCERETSSLAPACPVRRRRQQKKHSWLVFAGSHRESLAPPTPLTTLILGCTRSSNLTPGGQTSIWPIVMSTRAAETAMKINEPDYLAACSQRKKRLEFSCSGQSAKRTINAREGTRVAPRCPNKSLS